jgi:hypothetical protein
MLERQQARPPSYSFSSSVLLRPLAIWPRHAPNGIALLCPTAPANVAARSCPAALSARAQRRSRPTSPPALVQWRRSLAPNGVVRSRPTASSARTQLSARAEWRRPLAPNNIVRSRPTASSARNQRFARSRPRDRRCCPLAPNGAAPSCPAVPPSRAKRRCPLAPNGVACSRPMAPRNIAARLRPAAVCCPPLCLRTVHFSLYGTWCHVHPVL